MPNCDFYAAGFDHREILTHLLSAGDCEIYPLSSEVEEDLRFFRNLGEIEKFFQSYQGMTFQLFPRGAGGKLLIRRVDFPEKPGRPATFRFEPGGWGLVQLYLEQPLDGFLSNSHTNHNSETRARNWAAAGPELGDPSLWMWSHIESFSRKLIRFIRSKAVGKIGSRVVLPGAEALVRAGVKLQ